MLSSIDLDDNVGIECRICHSKTTKDLILSPCLCKGTMGCVHIGCLEQWLNFSSHNSCELCSYKFEVIQTRKYSFFQSIFVWIRRENASCYKALFFFLLSAINAALLSWLWILWISKIPNTFFNNSLKKASNEDVKIQEESKTKWIIVFIFLTVLTIFSVKSLCCDVLKIIKNHYNSWYSWWNETVDFQLVVDLQNYDINMKLDKTDESLIKQTEGKSHVDQRNRNFQEILIDPLPESNTTNKVNNLDLPALFIYKNENLNDCINQKLSE